MPSEHRGAVGTRLHIPSCVDLLVERGEGLRFSHLNTTKKKKILRLLLITGFEQSDYCMNWCHLPRRSCALDFKEPHASWVYTFQEIQKHFGHYFFKCTFFTPFHFSGGLKSCVYYAALVIYLIIRFIWDSFHSCVFIQLNIRLTITGVTFT